MVLITLINLSCNNKKDKNKLKLKHLKKTIIFNVIKQKNIKLLNNLYNKKFIARFT